MKQNGALHKIMEDEFSSPGSELVSNILYAVASDDTPLRKDAFELSDEEKIKAIAGHFRAIMNTLGLDLQNDAHRWSKAKYFFLQAFVYNCIYYQTRLQMVFCRDPIH